eukprot:scaffold127338_cov47-Attheya_sp.AAC.1
MEFGLWSVECGEKASLNEALENEILFEIALQQKRKKGRLQHACCMLSASEFVLCLTKSKSYVFTK